MPDRVSSYKRSERAGDSVARAMTVPSTSADPGTNAGMPVLLEARAARVDVGGAPTLEGLTFATTSTAASARVLIVGAPRALFEAASGVLPIAHGTLLVNGIAAHDAVARRVSAGAPLDPQMPPTWSVRDYVTWSARLAGHSKSDATARATQAMARMRLEVLETARLEKALPHVRRATVLAAMFATGATTFLVEDPLANLPEEVARPFARVVLDAFAGSRVVFFAGRTSLTSPLAAEVDEALVLAGPDVVAQGAPAEIAARTRSFAVRLTGDLDAFATFRDRATLKGIAFEADGARVVATLPDGVSTTDLMNLALDSRAVIIELRPLAPGFA